MVIITMVKCHSFSVVAALFVIVQACCTQAMHDIIVVQKGETMAAASRSEFVNALKVKFETVKSEWIRWKTDPAAYAARIKKQKEGSRRTTVGSCTAYACKLEEAGEVKENTEWMYRPLHVFFHV